MIDYQGSAYVPDVLFHGAPYFAVMRNYSALPKSWPRGTRHRHEWFLLREGAEWPGFVQRFRCCCGVQMETAWMAESRLSPVPV